MHNQWLQGHVRHRRLRPVGHGFRYRTGMLAVDLDHWSSLDKLSPFLSTGHFNWLWVRRKDYFRPDTPDIAAAVRDYVESQTGWRPDGCIQLITHPRYLGFCFNPVSFYFCFEAGQTPGDGAVPRVIVAQITNTPWLERYCYCLDGGPVIEGGRGWRTRRYRFAKAFHVSPFNPMEQDYDWLFSFRPGECRIHMNVSRPDGKDFDATLEVRSETLETATLHRALRQFPLESIKVVAGIYWHALRLKLKGAPFYDHPDKIAPGKSGAKDASATKRKTESWKT